MPNIDKLFVKRSGSWKQPSSMLVNNPELEYVKQVWVKVSGVWVTVWERSGLPSASGHNSLVGRDEPDAHPISAITGLAEAIADAADKHYTHVQATPSSSWAITHGLGKYPSITVLDSSGQSVEGDVLYVDLNNVTLNFNSGFSGTAVFN